MHEPFRQWAVQDDFVNGDRPDLAAADAQLVDDVAAFEDMKLRMLNGTHSALAYLGYLAGHETISGTVADPAFAAYVRHCWEEIMPAVAAPPGVDLTDYADALFDRYANPAIRHRTWQIAMDGSQKLPQRLLVTTVEDYQARGSQASCQFMVTLYPELLKSHGTVLVRGDVMNPALLEWPEARTLLPALCSLYTEDAGYELVRAFNHTPAEFDFNTLLALFGIAAPPS
jgi:mannitol-1-phosphate/altronate dehydrogenase